VTAVLQATGSVGWVSAADYSFSESFEVKDRLSDLASKAGRHLHPSALRRGQEPGLDGD